MIYNKLEGTSSTSFKLGKSGIVLEQDLEKGLLVVKKGDQIITIGMGIGDTDIRDQDVPNLAKITSDINNAISTLNSDIEKHLIKGVYFDSVQKNKLVIEFNGQDISDIEVEFGTENIQGLETLIEDNIAVHNTSSEAHADIRGGIHDHIFDKDNPHTVTKSQIGLGNVDDTSDINKPVSTATAQKISTDIAAHNTSSIAHSDIRTKITTDISTHNVSSEAHADMREQISDLEAEIDRIDGKGKSYGEIDYTQTQLEGFLNEGSRNLAITDDIVERFPGYTPSNGDLIYTKESAGENVHEWEYNSSISGWVDNGAYVVQRATNSSYGIVKGGQYISIANGEMTTLRSKLLGGVDDTYSFSSLQLYNILDGKESLLNKTIDWNTPNNIKYPTSLLVKTSLDSKLDIINSAGAMRAYGIDTNGAAIVHSISNTLLGNSIPIRDVNNQFHVGMATHDNHPVPYNQMVSYVNTEGGKIDVIKVDGTPLSIVNKEVNIDLSGKATKLNINQHTVPYRTLSGSGETNTMITVSEGTVASTIPARYTDGRLRVGDAVETADAVPLGQLDTKLSTLETTLENYVDEFGGKIDVIKVDGTALPITDKEVNIDLSGKATKLNIGQYYVPYRNTAGIGEADSQIYTSINNVDYSLAQRYIDSRLRVGTAVEGLDAVNLDYGNANYFRNRTSLVDTDLNTLSTIDHIGLYYQTSVANATPENNYPVARAGSLRVYRNINTTSVIQEYSTHNNNNWGDGFYRRTCNSGVWSDWVKFATETWVDNNYTLKNSNIIAGTSTKITYDSKGLVTGGASLIESDIPTLSQSKITNLTSDLTSKLNVVTSSTTNPQAYIKTTTGSQEMLNISSTNTQDSLVVRDANNTFHVGTATDNNSPVPLGQLNSALSGKSDIDHTHSFDTITDKPTTIAGYNINDAYTKSEIDGMLESGIKYKGSVADLTALESIVGPDAGDMYSVIGEGNQPYIFDGTNWNEFGGTIDLSAYETIADNNTKLSGKVDKVTTALRVYSTGSSGEQIVTPYSQSSNVNTIAQRYTDGRLRVGTAVENVDAVNLGQMNTALDSKGTKLNIPQYTVPYRNIEGAGEVNTYLTVSDGPADSSIAVRLTGGRIQVGTGVSGTDAVNLTQMNTALATKLNSSAKGETDNKTLTFGGTFKVLETLADGTVNERTMTMPANPNVNNYLTGVSGSGNDTVTFTRQGLGNLTWDANHTHPISEVVGLESQFGNTYGTNLAMPDLSGATEISAGVYRYRENINYTLDYEISTGIWTYNSKQLHVLNDYIFTVDDLFPSIIQINQNYYFKFYPISAYDDISYQFRNTDTPNVTLYNEGLINIQIVGGGGLRLADISGLVNPQNITFKLQLEKGSTATPYTVPLPFSRKEFDDKLTKVSTGGLRRVYGVNTSNAQEMLEVINTTKANTVPFRDSNGNFEIGNATADAHAINRITADGRYAPTSHTHSIAQVTNLQSSLDGKENTITAGTTSQYWRGDKTWQTLNKTAVGLANVDNTADLNKPISTATQSALNNKLDTITTSGLAAYTKNGSTQSTMAISSSATANTLAERTTGGRLKVSTATEDDDAVNKLQMVSYVDDVIEGLPNALIYIGAWNANTNTPTLLANNLATKGHVYRVTVAGTRFSIVWEVNDLLVYNNDGNVEKWDITDPTGYEVMSNKITAWGSPTDIQYPSAKLVKDSLDGKLNTVNTINTVYGVNSSGVQVSYTNSAGAYANTVGFRYTDGRLRVGNAVETADSVPLGQLQTMIDEMFSIEIWESGD